MGKSNEIAPQKERADMKEESKRIALLKAKKYVTTEMLSEDKITMTFTFTF
ncbi:MAG: hypothetical protein OWQ54_09085 [Sulfolobaceae archaeon]|nr:hypothetical protein [Sulfolobaceae archaeon]